MKQEILLKITEVISGVLLLKLWLLNQPCQPLLGSWDKWKFLGPTQTH